jgi:hypothetical protein
MTPTLESRIELADYRAVVADLYAAARAALNAAAGWNTWRKDRDVLLRTHPQSPLADRAKWAGSSFFPYDPSWRVLGSLSTDGPDASISAEQTDGLVEHFDPVGSVHFTRRGDAYSLPLYWTRGYSGGLFLPFGDTTNGVDTYGSGRYLVDQAKSAFLGFENGRLVLDFNFAYHPSCVWGGWICPLPRPQSRLDVAVTAGERLGS